MTLGTASRVEARAHLLHSDCEEEDGVMIENWLLSLVLSMSSSIAILLVSTIADVLEVSWQVAACRQGRRQRERASEGLHTAGHGRVQESCVQCTTELGPSRASPVCSCMHALAWLFRLRAELELSSASAVTCQRFLGDRVDAREASLRILLRERYSIFGRSLPSTDTTHYRLRKLFGLSRRTLLMLHLLYSGSDDQ